MLIYEHLYINTDNIVILKEYILILYVNNL